MTFERIRHLIGTWQLVATRAVDDQGRPVAPPYGSKPRGIVTFGLDGRMMAVLTDGRSQLPAGAGVREFNAYAGNFTFDGETLVTRVDASSNAHWIGGEQVRTAAFEGERLILRNGNRTLTWEKVA